MTGSESTPRSTSGRASKKLVPEPAGPVQPIARTPRVVMPPLFVLASLFASLAIISAALSDASRGFDATAQSLAYWLQAANKLLLPAALAGWPWLVAFIQSFSVRFAVSSVVFSVLAAGLSAMFYMPIESAPAEGRGWYIVIYLLAVWIAFLVSLAAREKKPDVQVKPNPSIERTS